MKKTINSKKGVSEIITSVLLILVVISAVIVLSVYINKQVSLSPQLSCAEAKLNPPVTIEKACFNSSSKDTEITLNRVLSSEIKKINLIMQNSSNSSTYAIGENCNSGIMLAQGETREYFISGNFQSVSVSISNCMLESVKIENC